MNKLRQTGGPPFSHNNYITKGFKEEEARRKQQEDIQKSDIGSRLTPQMSLELRDFLRKTLAKEPRERMTTTQMIHHPFITKYNDISQEMEAELFFDQNDNKENQRSAAILDRSKQCMVATPAPGMFGHQAGPAWHLSRHFLSAASSPNSGPLASGPTSPFPFIRAQQGDTPGYVRLFAPPINGSVPRAINQEHPLSDVLLKDGRIIPKGTPDGFALVRMNH
eukprot:Gregarina_sp_Poly_1__8411@NODE_494_length_7954_cov_165_977304_g228_i1_p5_GENE_NODE_494_length_7954_cov_165_977304_g228_i1NODE_494_length_7954_cov_165_977304_g228_i1_p5_ORF_typecomplete_len222_score33_80Pkinase/PF00069_25/0_0016_NODE_494_length_7954_cov_165_977304_g228_i14111076